MNSPISLKGVAVLLCTGMSLCHVSTVSGDVILVDFGLAANVTSSPDSNGNTWNNMTGPTLFNMTNTAGLATTVDLQFSTVLAANNPGGLTAPNAGLLGSMAVSTATEDYYFTTSNSTFRITGLNPSLTYNLRFFGTRALDTPTLRETTYTATGGNGPFAVDLTTTGQNIGNDGIYDGNDNTIVSLNGITPNGSNEITVDYSVKSGGFAYLGVLEIAAVPEPGSVTLMLLGGAAGLWLRRSLRRRA